MSFDRAIKFVLDREGGLVNDPNDPGGITKYGISKRAYPSLDIASLTREDAIAIYRRDYWSACKCDQLPPAVACVVFDAAVNQGTHAATIALQNALGIKADGVIGQQTLAQAKALDGKELVGELIARRMVAYGSIANFSRYGLGWSRRLAACHQLALEVL